MKWLPVARVGPSRNATSQAAISLITETFETSTARRSTCGPPIGRASKPIGSQRESSAVAASALLRTVALGKPVPTESGPERPWPAMSSAAFSNKR